MLTIDLLRHGKTKANPAYLYGATDVELSEVGKKQLSTAFHSINQEPITHITSSPMQRCRWLAHKVQHHATNNITFNLESGFSEMNFGDWEGADTQTLIKKQPHFRQDVRQLSPPNGESFTAFSRRINTTWQDYIQTHLEQGGHHLLLTHGGVIRVLLGLTLHIPDQHLTSLFIPHASWSRISFVQGEKPILWFMNRHAE